MNSVERAKDFLETQNIDGVVYFRSVPLDEFTKEELIKILALTFNEKRTKVGT